METGTQDHLQNLINDARRMRSAANNAYVSYGVLGAICAFFTLVGVEALIIGLGESFVGPLLLCIFVPICFLSCMGSRWCYFEGKRVRQKHKRVLETLMMYQDVRVIPVMLDEMWHNDTYTRNRVHTALTRLLPMLTLDDAHLLNASQREKLYNLPFPRKQMDDALLIAVFRAIGQIGDTRALRILKRFGSDWEQRNAEGILPRNQWEMLEANGPITTAYHEAAATIEARLAAAKSGATLLRASAAPDTAPDVLLRAASAAHATPPEQLLRATTGSPTDTQDA